MSAEPHIAESPIEVHAWLDVACPWCWIATHRFAAAVEEYGGPVELQYHSYELAPDLGLDHLSGQRDDLRDRYPAGSDRDLDRMLGMVATAGSTVGLTYNIDQVRRTSTFRAHQLLQLAGDRKQPGGGRARQGAVLDALFTAYFTDGRDLRDSPLLLQIAEDAGIEAATLTRVLDRGGYTAAIRADRDLARSRGVQSIPTYLIGTQPAIHGAKKTQFFTDALRRQAAP